MKRWITSLLALATMVFVLGFPVAVPAAPVPPKTQPKALPAPPAPEEPHPEIRDAIQSLRVARNHLEHANHDFGGHRVDAIKAIDEAIAQLQACLQYDKH
ncbi:MAG: hypothetical protein ACRD52_04975 [Candidatus Acidiferrales bacterium]